MVVTRPRRVNAFSGASMGCGRRADPWWCGLERGLNQVVTEVGPDTVGVGQAADVPGLVGLGVRTDDTDAAGAVRGHHGGEAASVVGGEHGGGRTVVELELRSVLEKHVSELTTPANGDDGIVGVAYCSLRRTDVLAGVA